MKAWVERPRSSQAPGHEPRPNHLIVKSQGDGQLDATLLDIKDRVGRIALRVDHPSAMGRRVKRLRKRGTLARVTCRSRPTSYFPFPRGSSSAILQPTQSKR